MNRVMCDGAVWVLSLAVSGGSRRNRFTIHDILQMGYIVAVIWAFIATTDGSLPSSPTDGLARATISCGSFKAPSSHG